MKTKALVAVCLSVKGDLSFASRNVTSCQRYHLNPCAVSANSQI